MPRNSVAVALALSTFLLISNTSAQQAAAPGAPARTTAGGGPDTVVNCANAQRNYIPVFTATAPPNITICNSAIYQNSSGNVGVGTTTPSAELEVNGSISTSANYQILGANVLSVAGAGNLLLGLGAGTSSNGGSDNTLVGSNAGASTTTSTLNTFVGYSAGQSANTGSFNAFVGADAGMGNTNGSYNTFAGFTAGALNGTASYNTFVGYASGLNNTGGIENTYLGANTGTSNAGNNNTLIGYAAGQVNTGFSNTFLGSNAGVNNNIGESNTFVGNGAGNDNTSGSGNTFIGANAGTNNTLGSGNVYLANQGNFSESETIRIGQGQTTTYIAGIYNTTSSSGIAVYVNPLGQLGTQTSSLRFKEQVRDLGDSTSALMKLRPVTFLYKPEYEKSDRTLQYGLIAEEVAKVYPELVAYDSDGQPYSVRYQYLSTILLNEVQKQYRRAEERDKVIEAQQQEIESLKRQVQAQNAALQERLLRLEDLSREQVQTAAEAKP